MLRPGDAVLGLVYVGLAILFAAGLIGAFLIGLLLPFVLPLLVVVAMVSTLIGKVRRYVRQ